MRRFFLLLSLLLATAWLITACSPTTETAVTPPPVNTLPATTAPTATAVATNTVILAPATPTAVATTAPTATPILGYYPPSGRQFATLDEFWNGQAEWVMDVPVTGLPIGESDTVRMGEYEFWSYLHASDQSAGVVDQCGDPVPFPGCTTIWKSRDAGRTFTLEDPTCIWECDSCPCTNERDHIEQQQYPRVFITEDETWYLVYEFGANTFMRVSSDGVNWSQQEYIPGSGIWYYWFRSCTPSEEVGEHPNIFREFEWDCLAGGPPGIYIEGDEMYVFVALGKAPSHMGCFVGDRLLGPASFRKCETEPLFSAELGYGPVDVFGEDANPYFEYRTISSADVVKVGDYYYMIYEGVRGPSNPDVVDDQFALGLARSQKLDAPWERYSDNPIILDLPGNVGVGHGDLIIVDDATYIYTANEDGIRSRYVLVKK